MRISIGLDSSFFSDKKRENKAEYYILIVIYRLLLDFAYSKIIYPIYAYAGFEYNRNPVLYVFSWLLLLISAKPVLSAYRNKENKISFEILFLLYLMSLVPFSSMMAFGAQKGNFVIANIIYWAFLFFFILHRSLLVGHKAEGFSVGIRKLGDTQLIAIALVLGLITIYVSGKYAHFRMNFNLLGVYELRSEAGNNNLPTVFQYLFGWGRTIGSILIAYFIRKKKYGWAVFCVLFELLSFGYDGSKSTFFLLILAVGINFLPRMGMEKINKWVLRGFVILVCCCNLIYIIMGNYIPASIIVRRVLYLPVEIARNYFDFFTTHQPDYLKQSFLRYFGAHSNYEPLSLMIGRIYYDAPTMGANNGLISDAVANFGYLGILIYPMVISAVFKWLDRSAKGLDPRIYVTVAVYVSLVMTNSFFTTILLTHGLLVAIIVLSMMKREKEISIESILLEGDL